MGGLGSSYGGRSSPRRDVFSLRSEDRSGKYTTSHHVDTTRSQRNSSVTFSGDVSFYKSSETQAYGKSSGIQSSHGGLELYRATGDRRQTSSKYDESNTSRRRETAQDGLPSTEQTKQSLNKNIEALASGLFGSEKTLSSAYSDIPSVSKPVHLDEPASVQNSESKSEMMKLSTTSSTHADEKTTSINYSDQQSFEKNTKTKSEHKVSTSKATLEVKEKKSNSQKQNGETSSITSSTSYDEAIQTPIKDVQKTGELGKGEEVSLPQIPADTYLAVSKTNKPTKQPSPDTYNADTNAHEQSLHESSLADTKESVYNKGLQDDNKLVPLETTGAHTQFTDQSEDLYFADVSGDEDMSSLRERKRLLASQAKVEESAFSSQRSKLVKKSAAASMSSMEATSVEATSVSSKTSSKFQSVKTSESFSSSTSKKTGLKSSTTESSSSATSKKLTSSKVSKQQSSLVEESGKTLSKVGKLKVAQDNTVTEKVVKKKKKRSNIAFQEKEVGASELQKAKEALQKRKAKKAAKAAKEAEVEGVKLRKTETVTKKVTQDELNFNLKKTKQKGVESSLQSSRRTSLSSTSSKPTTVGSSTKKAVVEKSSPPGAPTKPRVVKATSKSIKISWSRNEQGSSPSGYIVEMATGKNGAYQRIKESLEGTSYTAEGLKAGSFYRFRIFAFNDAGESENSEASDLHEVVDDRGGAVSPSYTLRANTQEGMTVDAGKEINLEVGMGGSPAPTAKWTKDPM